MRIASQNSGFGADRFRSGNSGKRRILLLFGRRAGMQLDKRVIYGLGAAAVGIVGGSILSLRQASSPPLAPVSSAGMVEIPAGGEESASSSESEPSPPPTPTSPTSITVHVTGAVKRPGVYTLKTGDRVYHAIRAAGGLKPNAFPDEPNHADYLQDADQIYFMTREEYVQRNKPARTSASASSATPTRRAAIVHGRRPAPLTLPSFTKPLTAGEPVPLVTPAPQRVRPVVVAAVPSATPSPVPRGRVLGKAPLPVAEATPPPADSDSGEPADSVPPLDSGDAVAVSHRSARSSRSSDSSSTKFKNPGDGVVNINTAGAAELQKLPGVGPAMSQRILEKRQEIGHFRDVSQLMDVKGIGSKTFAKMQPFVRVE
jgi:competence protein ComEA